MYNGSDPLEPFSQIFLAVIAQKLWDFFSFGPSQLGFSQGFCDLLILFYKCDELNAHRVTPSQVLTGSCVLYLRVHFNVRQALVTSNSQWLAYSPTFQCVAGACHFLHPVTCLHFNVRQARVTSCTRWLAYISVWGRHVLLLAASDLLTVQRAWWQMRQSVLNWFAYVDISVRHSLVIFSIQNINHCLSDYEWLCFSCFVLY